MSKTYMQMKNEELIELMEKYELDKGDYIQDNGSLNRQKLSKILQLIDVQKAASAGNLEEPVAITEEHEVVEDTKRTKLHKNLSGVMVNMTFYSNDENDLPYLQLGLNGIGLIIPREKPVWVPKEFIDGVLNSCIQTKAKMEVENGEIVYKPREIPRFAHTVHDIKHIDVIRKDWEAKQKKNK